MFPFDDVIMIYYSRPSGAESGKYANAMTTYVMASCVAESLTVIALTTWWRHQSEIFSAYWLFVREIHRSPVNSPHKGQRRGALMFCLICAWIHGWVNNREAGDFRCHGAHYDVTVMLCKINGSSSFMGWLCNQLRHFCVEKSLECQSYIMISHKFSSRKGLNFMVWKWYVFWYWLVSRWTKWSPFRRRFFQMHIREWKFLYFD